MDDEERNQQAMVSAANAAYYDAFERKDLPTMASLWEPGDRSVCTHPGWPTIRGTDEIVQSYAGIFSGPQTLQVILTNELIVAPGLLTPGSLAYVSVDENLVDEHANTSSASGLNVFSWNDERWQIVVHHASPIMVR